MSNNLYDILAKFNAVEQTQEPVQQPKAKTQLAERMETVEGQLSEKYMGFKKTVAAIKKGGSADNPEAVAAAIGRKKYGKEKFQQAAAAGKKLGEQQGIAEGGFFDPDQPDIGDMVKHINGATGKVKKIGTQGDETHVYFKDKNGEMNFGMWKKHVFPIKKQGVAEGYSDMMAKERRKRLADAEKKKQERLAQEKAKKEKKQQGVAEAQQDESALQAYLGKKKYGEEGMKALQQAGRDGASKETMAKIRAKHDKMDEIAPPGAKAERMVKHIKKGYAKDGKLSDKERSIAYATAWKAHKAGKVEEAVAALQILARSGMTAQQITEGWEDMMKAVSAKSREEKGTGKFDKKKDPTTGGTVYTRKYNPKTGETDDTENVTAVKRGRGRPKKSAFEQYMQKYEAMLEDADPLGKFIKGLDQKGASAKTAPAPAPAMGTIKNGVWTADAPKPGEKGVPIPVPVDEDDQFDRDVQRVKTGLRMEPGDSTVYSKERGLGPGLAARRLDQRGVDIPGLVGNRVNQDSLSAGPGLDESHHELEEMMRLAGMGEALKGGQKKLDKNKNGRLDADDFARLRGEVDEDFALLVPPPSAAKSVDQAKAIGALKPAEQGKPDPFAKGEVAIPLSDLPKREIGGMEEGNEFSGALDAARDAGKSEFEVGGKTYPVKEEMDEGHETCTECGYAMTECGCDAGQEHGQEGHMNVSMNVDSDGNQNMSVSADGEDAVKLAQLLKLAGLGSGQPEAVYHPVEVVVGDEEEEIEEEKDPRYHASTTPDEEVFGIDTQIKGGNGDVAGQEKKMTPHGYQFGDNPIAMKETVARDYESIKVRK